jgi:zinc transport system ATP-binding protein
MGNIIVGFNSVYFSYGDIRVFENASFHIHSGEFIAMVGPNGSGKTTALKLLFGLEKPDAGTIEVLDSNIAYVSQYIPSDNLFPITAGGIVRMGLLHPFKNYPKSRQFKEAVEEAMEKTGITELKSRPYRTLSGGQKRRVLVARALAARPQLLVLDEPTANMDIESEKALYETLGAYKGKMTILIVTHDTEFVSSLTDRVLCLGDSRRIIQHRTEVSDFNCHGGSGSEARVLHNEEVSCC